MVRLIFQKQPDLGLRYLFRPFEVGKWFLKFLKIYPTSYIFFAYSHQVFAVLVPHIQVVSKKLLKDRYDLLFIHGQYFCKR